MKILHCADIHLDSPMETHMTRSQASKRSAELLSSFLRMTRYAAENEVRLVLIAGDLFDSGRVTGRTVEAVLDAMRATPAVQYLYLRGNHDESARIFADCALPENLFCFSESWQTFLCEDVAVSGICTTPENALSLYRDLPDGQGRFHIVMLHGQTAASAGADRVALNLLRERGVDYLALGHLHSYDCQPLDRRAVWCYPGCLEGRGFDECGPKGFVLLDTSAPRPRPEFVPFCARRLHRVEVDVTGRATSSEVYQAMQAASAEIPAEDMVEFVLTGRSLPTARISGSYLYNLMQGAFFFVKIKDESRMEIDRRDYQNDASLKGEFIRLVLAGGYEKADADRMIRAGLEALAGEEITL